MLMRGLWGQHAYERVRVINRKIEPRLWSFELVNGTLRSETAIVLGI